MDVQEEHSVIRVQGNRVARAGDSVCVEDTFRLYLNDTPLAQITIYTHPERIAGLPAE